MHQSVQELLKKNRFLRVGGVKNIDTASTRRQKITHIGNDLETNWELETNCPDSAKLSAGSAETGAIRNSPDRAFKNAQASGEGSSRITQRCHPKLSA